MGGKAVLTKAKPYLAIISLQFGYAGMFIITAACFKHGMNHFVLAVYRHVIATLVISPFAFFFERKTRPKMTLSIFLKIMLLGFVEPVLDQNMYYVGLQYTSAAFTSAMVNVLPAIIFILAAIFRLEIVDIRKIPSQAKIIGTIVTVLGAMVMTIYRGPVVNLFGTHGADHHQASTSAATGGHHWVAGTLLILASCLGWSSFFILQSFTLKEYPTELSLTAWICFMGSVEGGAVSLVMVRDMRAWALGWDIKLLASVYTGVICSGIGYYIQGVVIKERGPVFAAIFSPLSMIITAAFGSIILHELLHLGSIIGAVIIVVGLYAVTWGKSKDPLTTKAPSDEKSKPQELPVVNDSATNKTTDINNSSENGFLSEMSNIKIPPSQEV